MSWITILRKRENYRQAFAQFVPEKVAQLTDEQIQQLLLQPGLVRHKLKLFSIRNNARTLLKLEQQGVDFVEFIWQFVAGKPQINHYASLAEIPTVTAESTAMSKGLKQAGFSFIGPTICYAFMQSMGLVNDHLINCPQHPENLSTPPEPHPKQNFAPCKDKSNFGLWLDAPL